MTWRESLLIGDDVLKFQGDDLVSEMNGNCILASASDILSCRLENIKLPNSFAVWVDVREDPLTDKNEATQYYI